MNDTEVKERLAELGVVETEAEDEVLLVQDFADGRYAVITGDEDLITRMSDLRAKNAEEFLNRQ